MYTPGNKQRTHQNIPKYLLLQNSCITHHVNLWKRPWACHSMQQANKATHFYHHTHTSTIWPRELRVWMWIWSIYLPQTTISCLVIGRCQQVTCSPMALRHLLGHDWKRPERRSVWWGNAINTKDRGCKPAYEAQQLQKEAELLPSGCQTA